MMCQLVHVGEKLSAHNTAELAQILAFRLEVLQRLVFRHVQQGNIHMSTILAWPIELQQVWACQSCLFVLCVDGHCMEQCSPLAQHGA